MDIKDLNKSQLVLLTLLISFVASIATSIATVALLEEVPVQVAQPINRIIKQTIEKVVPIERTEVQTIIIKEQDLLIDAIEKNLSNAVSISDGSVKAKGILISSDGLILTGRHSFDEANLNAAPDEKNSFKAKILASDDRGFSIMKILPNKEGEKLPKFNFSELADSSQVKIGQTALVVAKSLKIVQTIVAAIGEKTVDKVETPPSEVTGGEGQVEIGDQAETPEKVSFSIINLGANLDKSYNGSFAIDIDGNIIGIVRAVEGDSYVIPSNLIKEVIAGPKS